MPKVALTDMSVKALKPPTQGQVTYWDTNLAGFNLRISQGGSKTFTLVHGEGRERITLGRYPVISLSQARQKAREILAEKTLGIAPKPASLMFEEALALFLASREQKNKPRTVQETRWLLHKHLLPKLRGKPVADVTAHDITRVTDALRDTPSAALHLTVAAKTMFRFLTRRKLIPSNPCEDLELPSKTRQKDRVLTDQELVAVYRAAEEYGYPFGIIVQILARTGQRRSEVAALRKGYLNGDIVTLPSFLCKNGREHSFVLGPTAISTLQLALSMACAEKNTLLFPARGKPETPFNGWSKSKAALDKRCPIAPWTLHDLRRTFSTNLARLGVKPHIIERILNHVTGEISGVAATYNRYAYLDETRDAMLLHERWLDGLLAQA